MKKNKNFTIEVKSNILPNVTKYVQISAKDKGEAEREAQETWGARYVRIL